MILWHAGGGVLLARLCFGRNLDYRVVLAACLLPDLVDKPVGRLFFRRRFESGRLYAHTLVMATLLTLSAQRGKRRAFVAAGVISHLILDAIWSDTEVALWPAFGRFPRKPLGGHWWRSFVPGIADRKLLEELAGASALVWIWQREGLGDSARRSEFLRTGRLTV